MPARDNSSGSVCVSALPSKTNTPLSGWYSPDNRLNRLVFPAPLGPMSAWRLLSETAIDTSPTAEKLPKDLPIPRHSKSGCIGDCEAFWRKCSGTSRDIAGTTRVVIAAVFFFLKSGAKMTSPSPIKPLGENKTKPINISPNNNCQLDVYSDSSSRNKMKNKAPSAGPIK